jgi:hypothetical protein
MGRSKGANGAAGAKSARGNKRPTGARPSRAPGRTSTAPAPLPAPPGPADQAPTERDPGGARIRAKRKGGLGDLGKLAWQKSLPELSLLDDGPGAQGAHGRRRLAEDDRPAAQALPPKTPAAQVQAKDLPPAPVHGYEQGQGTIPQEALSFLREELSAILALCQD